MQKGVLLGLLMLVIISCNKENKVVNKLDGEWIATEFKVYTDNYNAINYLSYLQEYKWNFNSCKKGSENCDVTITSILYSGSTSLEVEPFKVLDDGTALQVGNVTNNPFIIEYVNNKYLVLTKIDSINVLKIAFKKS